jgi:hypothetical protein
LFKRIIIYCLLGLSISCTNSQLNEFAHIEETEVRKILELSIAHHGGMQQWNKIKTLEYNKTFSLLDSTGKEEKQFLQQHKYSYAPIDIHIASIEDTDTIITVFKDNNYTKLKNSIDMQMPEASITKSVNTSTYVVGMPFKLLDPGVELSYLGTDDTPEGIACHVIQAVYNPAKHTNHSTSDIWKFYFDQETNRLLANYVESSDHANYVVNTSFVMQGGILWNAGRKSYRLKEDGSLDYLRANYTYKDYKITLSE